MDILWRLLKKFLTFSLFLIGVIKLFDRRFNILQMTLNFPMKLSSYLPDRLKSWYEFASEIKIRLIELFVF